MVLGLLLGGLAGLLLHRRGGVLAVLAVHWAVIELTRLPVEGPTVDTPHPQSSYGIIALVTGRLVSACCS